MRAMASQITSLTTVYSTIYSGAVIGKFPAQRASNVENVSIWWRHHDYLAGVFYVILLQETEL